MAGGDPASIYKVGQNTTRLLLAASNLVIGWLLLHQAEVALAHLPAKGESNRDTAFYQGKITAARFFTRQVLPRGPGAERAIAEATDNCLMDLDEARLLTGVSSVAQSRPLRARRHRRRRTGDGRRTTRPWTGSPSTWRERIVESGRSR